ncbi:MAG: Spy/CpxP family protein refolding chaperone [candidate division NC10 bacterium]|nr:Spy/CpxP family protein refolding chaperone [candidate division NC10 bacterium]
MKRTVVALGLVGALALTASAAFAWGPWFGRGMGMGYGHGYGYGPAVAAPNLSPEQVTKLQKIQGDRSAEMAKVRSEMFAKRAELQALFREPALDQPKIAAKQKEMAALQAQMQEKALAARTAMAEVLTPEQRAQMPAFGPGMGPGFGPGFGAGRGFGPGMGFRPRW